MVQNLILEYLNSLNLPHQSQNLKNDFLILKNSEKDPSTIQSSGVQQRLLELYDEGNRKGFFKLWRQNISIDSRNQNFTHLRVEFYIALYFCLYPLFLAVKLVSSNQEYNNDDITKWYKEEIKHFKTYLDLYGSDFSQTTEFLSFYALSYVENPITHSSFSKLFTEEWINERRNILTKFLKKEFPERHTSRIEKIVGFYQKYSSVELSDLWSKNEATIELVSKHNRPSGLGNDETNTFSRERSQNMFEKDISKEK